MSFNIGCKLGYFATGNSSSDTTCLQFLSKELGFTGPEHYMRYASYIWNLVTKASLFGINVNVFESEL